jgi:hypothetical protein
MNDRHNNRTIVGGLFRATLLALALVAIALAATTAGTSSASIPTNSPGSQEQQPGANVPGGGGCWEEISTQNIITGGNYLLGMDGDPETGAILAGGYITYTGGGGGISQTQMVQFYTGSSFQIVPNPSGLGDSSRLNGVGAIPGTDNEFWLVGNAISTTITTTFSINVIERFNGSSLSIVSNPQPEGVGQRLNDVDAASPTFAVAVGRVQSFTQGLRPVILRWNGTSWVAETPPSFGMGELSGVTTFPDGRAVAVGIDYDPDVRHVMITRDTGGVWSTVSLILPGSQSRLTAVDATRPTDIVAVGYSFNFQAQAFRPYSVFGNLDTNTWNIEYMPASATGDTYANAIACVDAPSSNPGFGPFPCYAGGEYDNGTTLDGAGWTRAVGGGFAVVPPDTLQGFFIYFAAVHGFLRGSEQAQGGVTGMYVATNYRNVGELNRVVVQLYQEPCGGPQPSPTPGGATPTRTPTVGPPTATPTPCTPHVYSDVPTNHTFYPFVTCLSQRGVVSGYSDCTFRPNLEVTRGQLTKMVSSAAGFNDDVTGRHTYTDLPSTHTFWLWVERLSLRGVMGGYVCGGTSEPCDPQSRPYFRPQNNATRGQVSKIVSNAANIQDPVSGQFYADVPTNHTFYTEIMRLTGRGVMSGYNCGGTGEPCDPQNRPYFRPTNNVTRGQSSKIVANTFFPNCQIR